MFDTSIINIIVPAHDVSIVENDNPIQVLESHVVGKSNRCDSVVKQYFRRIVIVFSSVIVIALVLFSALKFDNKTKIVKITMSPTSFSLVSPSESVDPSTLPTSGQIYPSYHPSVSGVPSHQPTYPLTWNQLGNDIYGYTGTESIGNSIALANDRLLVGGNGVLRVYGYKNEGSWSLENDLSSHVDGCINAISMTLDGKQILLGLGQYGRGYPGTAMAFREDDIGWVQIGMLVGEEEREYFGTHTAMSGDGTMISVSNCLCTVKVYEWSNEQYVLGNRFKVDLCSDKDYSIPISMTGDGSVLVVGNRLEKMVYVYELSSYSLLQKIKGNMAGFGSAVLLSEDKSCIAILSAAISHARIEIFRFDPVMLYRQSEIIIYPDGASSHKFRFSLCCKCKRLVVGLTRFTSKGRVGRVDIYAFRCDEWVLVGQMDGDNKEQYLSFGISVAMSNEGGIMAVGLPNYDGVGTNSGLVKVFMFSTSKNSSR